MQTDTKSVIIFGATSYLGHFVIDHLLRDGYGVIAVSRNQVKCSILLADNLPHVKVMPLDEINASIYRHHRPVAVINLAYIKDSPPYALYKRNRRLIQKIDSVLKATACERLIHVSTQAVFGYSFDHTPLPTDARLKRGDPYIETKIQAERLLRKLNKVNRYSLSIVRLGNIIGAGSPVWTAMPAQRILEGQPVGYQHALGYCNCTYSRNAADYICFLVQQPRNLLDHFGVYHHLAEFFDYPWSKMLEFLSSVIGKNFCLLSRANIQGLRSTGGLGYRMIGHLKKGTLGSYVRIAANHFIPEQFFANAISSRLKQIYVAQPHVGSIDQVPALHDADKIFFEIVGEDRPFQPHLMPGWSAPFTLENALNEIKDWLKRAGYVIQKDPELTTRS